MFRTKVMQFKNILHANLAIKVGSYGLFILVAACTLLHYFLEKNSEQILLPSFWQFGGELKHLLGTNQFGQDLFYLLLQACKNSFLSVLLTSVSILVLTCILYFFINLSKSLNFLLTLLLNVFMIIPTLLTVMAIILVFPNSHALILLTIGLSFLPNFMKNLRQNLNEIKQKDYFLTDKLEGFSNRKLFFITILPNIYTKMFVHFITLSSKIFLTITIITFFQLVKVQDTPDLGYLMLQVLSLYADNPWPFLSCGLVITLAIMFSHLIALGLEKIYLTQGSE